MGERRYTNLSSFIQLLLSTACSNFDVDSWIPKCFTLKVKSILCTNQWLMPEKCIIPIKLLQIFCSYARVKHRSCPMFRIIPDAKNQQMPLKMTLQGWEEPVTFLLLKRNIHFYVSVSYIEELFLLCIRDSPLSQSLCFLLVRYNQAHFGVSWVGSPYLIS